MPGKSIEQQYKGYRLSGDADPVSNYGMLPGAYG